MQDQQNNNIATADYAPQPTYQTQPYGTAFISTSNFSLTLTNYFSLFFQQFSAYEPQTFGNSNNFQKKNFDAVLLLKKKTEPQKFIS